MEENANLIADFKRMRLRVSSPRVSKGCLDSAPFGINEHLATAIIYSFIVPTSVFQKCPDCVRVSAFYNFFITQFRRLALVASPAKPAPNSNIVAGSGTGAANPGAEMLNVSFDVYAPVTTLTFVTSVPVPVAPAKIPVPPVMR